MIESQVLKSAKSPNDERLPFSGVAAVLNDPVEMRFDQKDCLFVVCKCVPEKVQ